MSKIPGFNSFKTKMDDLKKMGKDISDKAKDLTDKAKSSNVFDKMKSMVNPDAVPVDQMVAETAEEDAKSAFNNKLETLTTLLDGLISTQEEQLKTLTTFREGLTELKTEFNSVLEEAIRIATIKE